MMEMVFTIMVSEKGVCCSGTVNGESAYDSQTANLMAIAALEIARTSLVAQRWGLNLNPPLVEQPEQSGSI